MNASTIFEVNLISDLSANVWKLFTQLDVGSGIDLMKFDEK